MGRVHCSLINICGVSTPTRCENPDSDFLYVIPKPLSAMREVPSDALSLNHSRPDLDSRIDHAGADSWVNSLIDVAAFQSTNHNNASQGDASSHQYAHDTRS